MTRPITSTPLPLTPPSDPDLRRATLPPREDALLRGDPRGEGDDFLLREPPRPSSTGRAAQHARDAEDAHFRAFAAAQKLDPKETAELLAFARAGRVPLEKLERVGGQATYRTPDEKMMAMRSYAVADDAIRGGKVSPDDRRLFQEHILPNLERGAIKMQKTEKGRLGGAEATYDSDTDTYADSGIDLGSLYDRATTIHELKHATQDALRETSSRLDSEQAAYDTGAEYILRETGVLSDAPGGGTRIDGSKLEAARQVDPAEQARFRGLVARYGIQNVEQGRNHLNRVDYERFTDPNAKRGERRSVTELSAEDALVFFRSEREGAAGVAKNVWKTASFLANANHGKLLDVDVPHTRDGIDQSRSTRGPRGA